jgi:hypothetical protein
MPCASVAAGLDQGEFGVDFFIQLLKLDPHA